MPVLSYPVAQLQEYLRITLFFAGTDSCVPAAMALSRLDVLNPGWREILPGDHVSDLAVRLLDVHELRSADILQLAAALTWCPERPGKRDFLCAE